MKKSWIAVLPAAALLGAITTIPAEADAGGARVEHALACFVNSGSTFINSGGQVVNVTAGAVELICPVLSNTELGFKDAGVSVTVKGWSNGNGWKAKACSAFQDGHLPGTNCGAEFTAPGGLVAQSLDVSAWSSANPFDYPYLVVTLGPAVGSNSNVLFGTRLLKP